MSANQTELSYTGIGVTDTIAPWKKTEVHNFARKVTSKSIVLLKNENKLLPLDYDKIKSIAVIGPRANEILLDWYSGTPPYEVSILQGIKNAVENDVEVLYESSNEIDKAYNIAKKRMWLLFVWVIMFMEQNQNGNILQYLVMVRKP